MTATNSDNILRRIRAKKRGWVFTPKNFIDLASRNVIDVVLYRLTNKGIIRKLSYGIYDYPAQHPKLGTLSPNPDDIAKAIATKTGSTIQRSGARAANQLGLDLQVPAKPTYVTSGSSAKKNIGNYPIVLRHSKYTNNDALRPNVSNTINALLHLGKRNIDARIIKKLTNILSKKDKAQLRDYLFKLPDWMAPIILQITGNKDGTAIKDAQK